jgi:glycosyltransferase involved in cell wall biosynthesis
MISASMIVKNEEAMLEDCLRSIESIDEIVVVDTGSEDQTVEIAKKYTDRVIVGEYQWNDNFAEARNYSLSKCNGDWIFIIDADETLETPVSQLKRDIETDADVVNLRVTSDRTSLTGPRLFRNFVGVEWVGAVHNYLNKTSDVYGNSVVKYGYSPNHQKDPDRTIRILRKVLESNPHLVREKYYLGREHFYRSNWPAAIAWFDQYLEVAHWAPEWADALLLKAKCYQGLGEVDRARDCCLEALKINADFEETLRLMADLSGPNNRKKWLQYAALASNEKVLFVREGA